MILKDSWEEPGSSKNSQAKQNKECALGHCEETLLHQVHLPCPGDSLTMLCAILRWASIISCPTQSPQSSKFEAFLGHTKTNFLGNYLLLQIINNATSSNYSASSSRARIRPALFTELYPGVGNSLNEIRQEWSMHSSRSGNLKIKGSNFLKVWEHLTPNVLLSGPKDTLFPEVISWQNLEEISYESVQSKSFDTQFMAIYVLICITTTKIRVTGFLPFLMKKNININLFLH